MIKKVISGGQIGADVAALRAAKESGIETGGFAPREFRTLKGSNPALAIDYGLVEAESGDYPSRTFANVKNSDGTIRFAFDLNSPGERCTLNAIIRCDKPFVDVLFYLHFPTGGWRFTVSPKEVADWIIEKEIECLNVAGNAKPNIEPLVELFLDEVFRYLSS